MSCPQFENTSAYLDGELGDQASLAAERHIETCPHCQALVTAASEASELLRGRAAQVPAPAALRARIGRSLDDETAKAVSLAAVRGGRRPFWLGAACGIGASAVAAAIAFAVIVPPAAGSLATELAEAHVRALSSGPLIQVASSSHHTVKPWFAGRAPLSPPVHDFAAEGFPLAGGRVDTVAGRPAAVVVYRHGAHEIDLYAWPSRRLGPPPRAERRGYHLVSWTEGDLTLAAVSDVQAQELNRFVGLVKSARE
jgi:anti-sigma factor RsiW